MDFDFSGIIPAIPGLWNGMVMTLQLMVMGVIGGIALGTVLALMRLSSNKLLSRLAGAYVNYFRSIPLLLVITWFYLAVPFVLRWITGEDTPIGAFTSCVVAFMMFEAAYFCEIVRAGVQSIPKGQMGAAQAMGMTYGQTMRLIILPQAFRKMTPLLLQQSIILFQDTSLVYTVGLVDFLNSARSNGDIIGRSNEFLIFAGVVYFIISFSASLLVKRLQKKVCRMISIKNINKWYGDFQVLTDCSTEVKKRRSDRGVRAIGFGQIHPDQMRQRAGTVPERRHRGRWHVDRRPEDQPAKTALTRRHGVPALRTVPAPDHHRKPDHRADQGARPQQGRSHQERPATA